jgi:hypothetical protein
MKTFLEKIFKSKKQKQKELLDEIINTQVKEQATEVAIKAISKKIDHIDCECKECINRIKQNAK